MRQAAEIKKRLKIIVKTLPSTTRFCGGDGGETEKSFNLKLFQISLFQNEISKDST